MLEACNPTNGWLGKVSHPTDKYIYNQQKYTKHTDDDTDTQTNTFTKVCSDLVVNNWFWCSADFRCSFWCWNIQAVYRCCPDVARLEREGEIKDCLFSPIVVKDINIWVWKDLLSPFYAITTLFERILQSYTMHSVFGFNIPHTSTFLS